MNSEEGSTPVRAVGSGSESGSCPFVEVRSHDQHPGAPTTLSLSDAGPAGNRETAKVPETRDIASPLDVITNTGTPGPRLRVTPSAPEILASPESPNIGTPVRPPSRLSNYGSISPSPWPGQGQTENNSYQYEEFFGGTIQCPSCRGAGRIPREKENELVALIPFSDQRLKPRRTKLYVILAVAICALIGGLLLFFLFPRTVQLLSNMKNLTPTIRYVNKTEQYVFLSVVNEFNVSNQNYFNVEVTEVSVQAFYDTRVLSTVTNDTKMTIPMRKQCSYYVHINMTFSQEEGFVSAYCSGHYRYPHTLLLPFQVTMTSKSMGRSEQMTLTTYQHVLCSQLSDTTEEPPQGDSGSLLQQ